MKSRLAVPGCFVAFAAGWPFFNILSSNFSELTREDLLTLAGGWTVAAVITVGVFLLLGRRWRSPGQAAVICAPLATIFCSYGAIASFVGSALAARELGVRGAGALSFCLLAAGLLGAIDWLARSKRGRQALVSFMLAGACTPIAIVALRIGDPAEPPDISAAQADDIWGTALRSRPDIYHIILDGYARADTLRDSFGLDTSAFLRDLKAQGFVVATHSGANYPTTYLSLASVLSMGYPVDARSPPFHSRNRFYKIIRGENLLVSGLKRNGYAYVHMGNAWSGSRCSGLEDQCLNDRLGVFGSFTEVQRTLLDMTPLGVLARSREADLDFLIRSLPRVRAHKPFYLFAHTFPPHPPYGRNADCSLRSGWLDTELQPAAERELYRGAVECVNRQVAQLIEAVMRKDPEAVIVVQSDHGSDLLKPFDTPVGSWTEAQLQERFRNFSALKLPRRCASEVPQALTNVNLMRFVVGCLQERPPSLLPDRFFVGTYEQHSGYGTVLEVPNPTQ